MHGVKVFTTASAVVLLMALGGPVPVLADTIEAALVRAYQNNPQLNAQRAQVTLLQVQSGHIAEFQTGANAARPSGKVKRVLDEDLR